jgi:hypothetical protein
MLEAVTGGGAAAARRKRRVKEVVVTEAYPESAYNLAPSGGLLPECACMCVCVCVCRPPAATSAGPHNTAHARSQQGKLHAGCTELPAPRCCKGCAAITCTSCQPACSSPTATLHWHITEHFSRPDRRGSAPQNAPQRRLWVRADDLRTATPHEVLTGWRRHFPAASVYSHLDTSPPSHHITRCMSHARR